MNLIFRSYIYNSTIREKEILLFAVCNIIDESGGYFAKQNKSEKKIPTIPWYHIYVDSKKCKNTKLTIIKHGAEKLPEAGGGGNRKSLLKGYKFSVIRCIHISNHYVVHFKYHTVLSIIP